MAAAMTRVEAEFQAGKRVVFTARARSSVNVRLESADGGPVGYTSYELLLIALANCTLGVVMGHGSLEDVPVRGCRAVIEATAARGPSRLGSIDVRIELDVEGGNERLQETLERVADACPIGNTLKNPPQINLTLALNEVGTRATGAAAD